MPSWGERNSRAEWRWLLGAWGVALLGMYALTLRPSIGWNDSPEFVDVAYTLGIPHPPGSPTYVMLAKLGTFVPLGGIAARVNLFSALCTVLMLIFLVASLVRLGVWFGGRETEGRIAGVLSASLLAVGPTVWNYATQAEVYACFILMVALLLYLAIRWSETKDERFLQAGAFVFGASGGVHGTVIFFAPALMFLFVMNVPRGRLMANLARVVVFGLLGVSIYFYLPIRAVTEPAINWGRPDTFARFLTFISDRKDASYHFPVFSRPWMVCLALFARNLHAEVTAVGLVGALCGLALLLRRMWRFGMFTILFCAGNVLFFILIWTIPDAYLPTFLFTTLWNGIALAALFKTSGRLGVALRFSACAAVLLAVAHLAQRGGECAAFRANDEARSMIEANTISLPQDAVVFVTATWFLLRHVQDVEGFRPDLKALLISDLTHPEFFTPVTGRRYPNLILPRGLDAPEKWTYFFKGVLRLNLPRFPIFWEPGSMLERHVYVYLRPWRYFWRFGKEVRSEAPVEEARAYVGFLKRLVLQELDLPPDLRIGAPVEAVPVIPGDPDAFKTHAYLLMASADVLTHQSQPREALKLLDLASFLAPDDAYVASALGKLYGGFRSWTEARKMFQRAVSLTPDSPVPLVNMAILNTSMGRLEEAHRTLEQALKIGPEEPEVYHQIYVVDRKLGRMQEAQAALERAVALAGNELNRRAWQAELTSLSTEERR